MADATGRGPRYLSIVAIVLSVTAIAASVVVYTQLPAEISLDDLSGRVAALEADGERLASADRRHSSAIEQQATRIEQIENPMLGSYDQQITEMSAAVNELRFDLDEVTIELGHCLLREAEGGGYTYFTDFGSAALGFGKDYVVRCD
jgi:hypothetical protein